MTWAKLDDGITETPAMLSLERGVRLVHLEAIVWACRHETDGHIASHVLRRMTDEPDCDAAAGALVDVGLWEEDEDGWWIVGFLDHQRSAEDIAKARKLTAERQRRHRQHTAGDHSLCDPRYCRAASRVSNGVTDDVSNGPPSRPDPSRPDLTRTSVKGQGRESGPGQAPDGAGQPGQKRKRQEPPADPKLAKLVREVLLVGYADIEPDRFSPYVSEPLWSDALVVRDMINRWTWDTPDASHIGRQLAKPATKGNRPCDVLDDEDLRDLLEGLRLRPDEIDEALAAYWAPPPDDECECAGHGWLVDRDTAEAVPCPVHGARGAA